MANQRHINRLRALTLILALVALGVMLTRLRGEWDDLRATPAGSPAPSPSPSPSDTNTDRVVPREDIPTPQPDLTLTLAGRSTPADDWSNRLLDRALTVISEPLPAGSAIVWWRGADNSGQLALGEGGVLLGSRPLDTSGLLTLDVLTPNPDSPDQLQTLGRVSWEGDALMLTARGVSPGEPDSTWLLSGGTLPLALSALVEQAEARGWALTAAYSETLTGQGALVLLAAVEPGDATPTPFAPPPDVTLSPTPTVPPPATPTPTRVPEPYMGEVIAGVLEPVMEDVRGIPQEAMQEAIGLHPWAGPLTWTETGPLVDGIPVAVQAADELNLYTLYETADGKVGTRRFLEITFDGSVTRFPEQQVLFQEQRMEEALYWIVRTAAEEGGRLYVALDDFGARQSLTVLAFRPYSTSPSE